MCVRVCECASAGVWCARVRILVDAGHFEDVIRIHMRYYKAHTFAHRDGQNNGGGGGGGGLSAVLERWRLAHDDLWGWCREIFMGENRAHSQPRKCTTKTCPCHVFSADGGAGGRGVAIGF